MNEKTIKPASNNPLDIFLVGARKGFNLAINSLMPNVIMAFVLTEILKLLGVMAFLGNACGPLMGVFGLNGEAITVLLAAWLSASAGIGVAVSLLDSGHLTAAHITIMMPAIFLMASQIQYMGRLLGVADVPKKYWPLLMFNSLMNAVISMFIMRIVMQFSV